MARPETHADLSISDRRGDEIARWSGHIVMGRPSVAKHIVAAAEAADKLGLIVDNDGIYDRPSVEVLEDRLRRAQERWDDLKNQYEVALDYQSPSSDLYYINNWARDNGMPTIKPMKTASDQF